MFSFLGQVLSMQYIYGALKYSLVLRNCVVKSKARNTIFSQTRCLHTACDVMIDVGVLLI